MLKARCLKWSMVMSMLLLLFSPILSMKADAALATGDKFLGNIIANNVPANFGTYWNQVTPENSTKWGAVERTRNVMNWTDADKAYNYARSNGMPFKFHTLVWGSQEPSWVSGLSAANQRAELLQWIQASAQRYPNAEYIDVVNEPLHAKPSYRNAIGGDGATGWDWVIWSFEQARQAFPRAKLLINEYGIISDPNKATQYIQIINLLKNRGLIDGIGIQSHYFNMDNVSITTMNNVLNRLAATGLPIYVSELDISGDDQTQLLRYQQKFPVLWEHPSVRGITLWGYIEGQTWASNTHLIRSNGTERPALQWLKQYMNNQSGGGQQTQLATFEGGIEGWSGGNMTGGPWSTTAWSSQGSRSLQIDIDMSSGSQHYMYKAGNVSFASASQLKATVKGADWGNYGTGLAVKLYVKYGNNWEWKDSGWQTIGRNGTRQLTLDLSGIDKSNIREYGIQFIGGSGASGITAVYVDDIFLVN